MKYLSNYIEEATTKTLKDTGAFFAFSDKQFDEQKQPNIKYTSCGMGLICPTENVARYISEMDNIIKAGIAQDIAENGIPAIIKRELNNHEAGYTGDTESTEEALSGYPITKEEIRAIFRSKDYKLALTL